MNTLIEIIDECKSGNSAAFDKLVSRYQDMTVGYGFSLLGDFHLAQDAAQEAFLQAYRDLPSLSRPESFSGWLRKIVFKYCDRIRRRKSIPSCPLTEAPELVDDNANPARVFLMTHDRQKRDSGLEAALEALSEADRTVITLFYMGEQSTREIGEFLQISEAAVKKRLQRARERLQERMLEMLSDTLAGNAPSHNTRFVEASSLLRKASEVLLADSRIAAAWLADSFGLPEDTGWSSAWLQVIVYDEYIDDFILSWRKNASTIGEPVLCAMGPQNAPPGGAYCQALYDGEAGPYEVNWYWQPRTGATVPTGTWIPSGETRPTVHVLFNRAGVPESGEVLRCSYNRTLPDVLKDRLDARTDAEVKRDGLEGTIHGFWFMLLISARWIGGAPEEAEPRHLDHIRGLLTEVQRTLGVQQSFPPTRVYSGSASKLSILRETAAAMEDLMPRAADMFGTSVNRSIIPVAYRFMDTVENA